MGESIAKPGSGVSLKAIIITLLILAALGLGVFSAKNYLEWKDVEISSGYSAQAIEHQYLASQRYLEALDYRVNEIPGLDFYSNLPATSDVIFLSRLPADLPSSHYQKLSQWIDKGGHLITGITENRVNDSAAGDFLKNHGIRARHLPWQEYEKDPAKHWSMNLPPESLPATIYLDPDYYITLSDTDKLTMGIEKSHRYYFLQVKVGAGYLTTSADNALFNNWRIGKNDNALLLSRAIETTAPRQVWISDTNKSFKGIFTLIWEQFNWAVMLLGVLLLFMLRRASVRLGPLETKPDTISSNFSQHFLAMSGFQFRHHNNAYILQDTRERVKRLIRDSNTKNENEMVAIIAQRTALDQGRIHHALYAGVRTGNGLVNATRTLQTILARLDSHQYNRRDH